MSDAEPEQKQPTGAACVPVACGVLAGDDLVEEWR